jgi:hypothetical protein
MQTEQNIGSSGSKRWTSAALSLPPAGTVLAALGLILLAGCRVIVQVPEGGQVVSDQGLVCSAGETCAIDVADTRYAENFEAVADTGYVFSQWHQSNGYLCGGSSVTCAVRTAFMGGYPSLIALLDSEIEVSLQPVFVPDGTANDDLYDVAEWQSFLQTVGSSAYRSNNFLYQVEPAEGNCDAGVLKTGATERFLYALNLIRKLHGLPAVAYDGFYNNEMQQANLVQLTNGYFTHYPQAGDTCFTAAAASGAGSANISWSSWQGDPARYALGWTNDNHNVSSLMAAGHRRWVLNPDLGYTSYGQAGGYSSMKVFGFGSQPGYELPEDLEYVAFPYNHYPYIMVEKGSSPTPWSLSMVPASGSSQYAHFTSANVSVVEVATGSSLNVHSEYSDTYGYGLRNFLSWMVDDWQYDTPYMVTITNVQMPDGAVRTIEYPVEIDYTELQ